MCNIKSFFHSFLNRCIFKWTKYSKYVTNKNTYKNVFNEFLALMMLKTEFSAWIPYLDKTIINFTSLIQLGRLLKSISEKGLISDDSSIFRGFITSRWIFKVLSSQMQLWKCHRKYNSRNLYRYVLSMQSCSNKMPTQKLTSLFPLLDPNRSLIHQLLSMKRIMQVQHIRLFVIPEALRKFPNLLSNNFNSIINKTLIRQLTITLK